MKTTISTLVISLCLFTSCKKDKNTCSVTVASIAGTYSFGKFEVGSNGVYQDITSQFESCQLDDKLILDANGTSTYQDLGVVCNPNGTETGTWSISADGKMTVQTGTDTDVSSADVSFDCTTLVLTADGPLSGYKFRSTIKKN
ncbi:hypothetical protein BH11BAC3_BH11BAC3_36490 [soil metagenome]